MSVIFFQRINITDKIIVLQHPRFQKMPKVELSSPVNFQEIRNKILEKNVIFIGSGFQSIYKEICSLASNVLFILKDKDSIPVDETGNQLENCEIENWHIFWTDIYREFKNSFLISIIYQVMHGSPTITERRIYRGIYEHIGDDPRFEYFLQVLKNPPPKETLEFLGKNAFAIFDEIISSRILKSIRKRRMFKNDDKNAECQEIELIVDVTCGDTPERETAFRLLETKRGQAAICVKFDFLTSSCKGIIVSDKNVAATVCDYYFGFSSGTTSICEGSTDIISFMNKLFETNAFSTEDEEMFTPIRINETIEEISSNSSAEDDQQLQKITINEDDDDENLSINELMSLTDRK